MYSKLAIWLKVVPMLLLAFGFVSNTVADTVVDVKIFAGDTELTDEMVTFGLDATASYELKPFAPPSGITSPRIYFRRTDWPADGQITDLIKDCRLNINTASNEEGRTESWALRVAVPSSFDEDATPLSADFDATDFFVASEPNFGRVTITGGKGETEGSLQYNNKDITDIVYTGVDRLALQGNTQYTISYAQIDDGLLTVTIAPNNIGGKWKLQSESESAWRDSGTLSLDAGTSNTIEFRPVAGYDTPADKLFLMGESFQWTGTYLKQQAKSFVVNYQFDGGATPPTVASTKWKLYNKGTSSYYEEFQRTVFSDGETLNEVPNGNYRIEFSDVSNLGEAWTTPTSVDVEVSSEAQITRTGVYNFVPAEVTVSPSSGITMLDGGEAKTLTFTMDETPTDDMTVTVVATGDGLTDVVINPASFTVTKSSFPAEGFTQQITITSNDITDHSSFNVNINVNGPDDDSSPDPRYDEVQKVVNVEVFDQDIAVPSDLFLEVTPNTAINLGKLKVGDEVSAVVLVENTDSGLITEPNVKAITTDSTGQVIVDEVFDVEGGKTTAFTFQFKATEVGTLSGANILVLATNRTGEPIVATIPVNAEVVATSANALVFDPDVIVARPEDATNNVISVEFDVIADIGTAVPSGQNIVATLTLPAEMVLVDASNPTGVTFSNVFGGVTLQPSADKLTYTYTHTTTAEIAAGTSQKLFTVTAAKVDTSTAGVIKPITSTFTINNASAATQTAQLAIDNSVQLATLDVDEDGLIYDSSNFSFDLDDLTILYNYISNKAFGDSDATILSSGKLLQGTTSIGSGVTGEKVLENVLLIVNTSLLDVDGDGKIYDSANFSFDLDDLTILYNYISNKAFGDSDSSIISGDKLLQGTTSIGSGMTKSEILENILKIIKL